MKELKITSQFKKDLKKYQNQPISSSCYDLELTQSCLGNILKVIGVIAGELPTKFQFSILPECRVRLSRPKSLFCS